MMRRTYALAGACALLILAAVLVAMLVTRQRNESPHVAVATSTSSGTAVTSPYDFTEADGPADFRGFGEAKFVSLTIAGPSGVKSYLLAHDSAGFATLMAELSAARETTIATPPPGQTTLPPSAGGATTTNRLGATGGENAGAGGETIGSTLTVVMADRTTYTFTLDLAGDVIVRRDRAWKTEEDLGTLLDRATQ